MSKFLAYPTHNWLRKLFYHGAREIKKTHAEFNDVLVIIANARYYAQLLRNRPVESDDSTENRTYYETLKISLVLEPSSPEQSARVDTLVVDSATRPFIPRATLPLDRSTARPSPFASKRPVASFVRVRRLFTTKRYISFPRYFLSAQRNHLSLPHLLARGAFSGDRGAFSTVVRVSLPRKNASANSTTRWVFRREKHPLIKSKETHLIVFFGVFFCSYFLQNACVFSVVFSLAPFPKSLQGLLRARAKGADFAGSSSSSSSSFLPRLFLLHHRASKRQVVPRRARSTHSLILLF